MKKEIAFSTILILLFTVSFAIPLSTISFLSGPSISQQGFALSSGVEMTLNFWVAHVESYFTFNTYFANNTLLFTPGASELFKYVDFNWGVFRVEYNATDTHATNFYTPWDVWNISTIPSGWTLRLKGSAGGNTLEFSADRGSYFARFSGPAYLDAFWYANTFLMTAGFNNFFLTGGTSKGAYTLGLNGNYGNFSTSVMGFSSPIMIFPNVIHQNFSQYLWLISYHDKNLSILTGITENEIRFQGEIPFTILGGNANLSVSGYYLGGFSPLFGSSGNFDFEKNISENLSFFLYASLNENPDPILWSGLMWRF